MKTGLTAIAFCLTFCYVPQPSVAQTVPDTLYGIIKTRNPFALSRQKRERLQRKAEKRCQRYLDKYGNPDLSTWDRADRMDYLHHKAVKVILILAPDYYRNYAYPVIKERMTPQSWGNKKRAYCYELTYYYDARQEECADNNRPQCASGKKTANHVHYPQGRLKSAMFFPRPTGKNKRKKMYGTEKRNFILMPFFVGTAILYTKRRN